MRCMAATRQLHSDGTDDNEQVLTMFLDNDIHVVFDIQLLKMWE